MQHEKKNFVYLQRQVQKHADCTSAMLSVTGFNFARRASYIPTVCQPRERLVMGFSSACNGLDDGLEGTPSFSCHKVKSITQMKTKKFQSKGLYAPVVGFSENDYSTSLQLDGEQWKTLNVLGNGYEISNFGRLKSTKWKTPRIMRCTSDKDGYIRIIITKRKNGKRISESYYLHRLVAMAWIGVSSFAIDHINGVKYDNRAKNLEYVTNKENMRRAWNNGLIPRRHVFNTIPQQCRPKFSIEKIEEIKSLYSPRKYTIKMLCGKFGCSKSTIRNILKGLGAYSTEKGGQQ